VDDILLRTKIMIVKNVCSVMRCELIENEFVVFYNGVFPVCCGDCDVLF
jgi:hypothetical protein